MKKQEPARVTGAELAVLEILWKRGALSIRGLADALYPKGTTSEYATVQKLLERLEAKGCVARDRAGFAHSFQPTVRRDDLIGLELEEVADKLCDGSLTPILVHLVEKTKLSAGDRAKILRLLEPGKKDERK